MLNWPVPAALLADRVPAGCELDEYAGQVYVSVVGFLFSNTRVMGMAVPGHRTFEEVNLRFYVRRDVDGDVRRGVTFIREFVPRHAVAALARWIYNEPYRTVPMSSVIEAGPELGGPALRARYRAFDLELDVRSSGCAEHLIPGSFEEFIAEHYWGYTTQRDGGTIEYQVEHPSWRIAKATDARLTGDVAAAYGASLGAILAGPPASAWIADGSAVIVRRPAVIAIDG